MVVHRLCTVWHVQTVAFTLFFSRQKVLRRLRCSFSSKVSHRVRQSVCGVRFALTKLLRRPYRSSCELLPGISFTRAYRVWNNFIFEFLPNEIILFTSSKINNSIFPINLLSMRSLYEYQYCDCTCAVQNHEFSFLKFFKFQYLHVIDGNVKNLCKWSAKKYESRKLYEYEAVLN